MQDRPGVMGAFELVPHIHQPSHPYVSMQNFPEVPGGSFSTGFRSFYWAEQQYVIERER